MLLPELYKYLNKGIKTPFYDEEDDHPDDPPSHGTGGWMNDKGVLVYDRMILGKWIPMEN